MQTISDATNVVQAKLATIDIIPTETEGKGDCAFHSTLGEWNARKGKFICGDVIKQRKIVADAVLESMQNHSAEMFFLVQEAIKALIMEDKKTNTEKILAAQKQYHQYQIDHPQIMATAWAIYEAELNKHADVIKYINEYCSSKKAHLNLNNLKLKFDSCLNENDSVLKGLILSIEILDKAFKKYNDECSKMFNWHHILNDENVIREYAAYLNTIGTWLLPHELHIIAIALNLKIEFYIKDNKSSVPNATNKIDTYNNSGLKNVAICFDGINHYERMSSQNQLTSQINQSAKNINNSNPNTVSDEHSKDKQEKILNDKIDDINLLYKLYNTLKSFLHKKISPELLESEINSLMLDVATTFHNLKWDVKNPVYIRNIYGKRNYKTGKENEICIDFERFAFLQKFHDSSICKNISIVICKIFDQCLLEIINLSNGILFILRKELFDSDKHPEVISKCLIIKEELSKIGAYPGNLNKTPLLMGIIDIYYDLNFIQKICVPDLLIALRQVDEINELLRWRYTFARIMTLIGEASKNLSDSFKHKYRYLPFSACAKIRDDIGHAHNKYIIKAGDVAIKLYKQITDKELELYQEELRKVSEIILVISQSLISEKDSIVILNKYASPLKEQLPKDQVELAEESARLDLAVYSKLNLETSLVLRSFRIECLLKMRVNHLNDINKLKMAVLVPTSTAVPISDDDKKKKRFLDKIQELETREVEIKKLDIKAELSNDDKKALKSAKQQLKNIEAKAQNPVSSLPKQIAKKPIKKIEDVENDLNACEDELRLLSKFNIYNEVLNHFDSIPNSKKIDKATRASHLVKKLESEINTLSELLTAHKSSLRNYASEHCIAVIGQLMRDLEECKSMFIREILLTNITVKQSFEHTIITRNKKVMHDPFTDHAKALKEVTNNYTLSLAQDVSAIRTIIGAQSIEEIQTNVIFTIVKTYDEIAFSYMRLGFLSKAEEYYTLAEKYTLPEHYADYHLKERGLAEKDAKTTQTKQIGSIYIVKRSDRVVIADGDPMWIYNRVTILYFLSQCLMRQDKFSEAVANLKTALDIYKDYHKANKVFLCKIISNYIIANINNGQFDVNKYDELLTFLQNNQYESYVNVIIHYTNIVGLENNNIEDALNKFTTIKLDKVQDIRLVINMALLDGLLAAAYAANLDEKVIKETKNPNALCQQAFEARDKAIFFLRQAISLFDNHSATLRHLDGDYTRNKLYIPSLRNLAKILGSQAVKLMRIETEKAYKLLQEAIEIQQRYHFSTSISYQSLAAIYEQLFRKSNDIAYLKEGHIASDYNLQHRGYKERAMAYMSKAAFYEFEKDFKNAFNCFIEAKLYYFIVKDSEKNDEDKIDERIIEDKLMSLLSVTKAECIDLFQNSINIAKQYLTKNDSLQANMCFTKCKLFAIYTPYLELCNTFEMELQYYQSNVITQPLDTQQFSEIKTETSKKLVEKVCSTEEYKNLGNQHHSKKDYIKAIIYYDKAIALNTNYKEAWFNKGLVYKLLKRNEQAQYAFAKALQIDPNYAKADFQYRLLQLPAQIIFAIADLKLTPDNNIMILEFGRGFQSGFAGHDFLYPEQPMYKKLEKTVSEIHPCFFANLPGQMDSNRNNELLTFLNYVKSSNETTIPSNKIKQYKGIYGGYQTRQVNDDILVMDNSPVWHIVGEDKYVMHQLFSDEFLKYRPKCEVFPLVYTPNLVKSIKAVIPGNKYVLKVPDLSRGEGVIIVSSDELEDILELLLYTDTTQLQSNTQKYSRKLMALGLNKEEIINKITQLSDQIDKWHTTNSGLFLVEEYCQSSLLKVNNKEYDATMRVAFLITIDEGNSKFIPLSCYWKLPDKPIGEGQLREQTISHIVSDKISSEKVSDNIQQIVYQQLENVMPHIFTRMFLYDMQKMIKNFLDKPEPYNQTQASNLTLHNINALGSMNRFAEAYTLFKKLKEKTSNYYHEKGVHYFSAGNANKAVKKFSKAIQLNPHKSSTFFRRAKAYAIISEKDKALSDFEEAKKRGFSPVKIENELSLLGIMHKK